MDNLLDGATSGDENCVASITIHGSGRNSDRPRKTLRMMMVVEGKGGCEEEAAERRSASDGGFLSHSLFNGSS